MATSAVGDRVQTMQFFQSRKISFIQYSSSLTHQAFPDYLGILRFDSHFFQGCAEMQEELVEVRVI